MGKEMKPNLYIYKLTTVCGQIYYGKTKNPEQRMYLHMTSQCNPNLKPEFDLFGKQALYSFEVLVSEVPEPYASYYENKYIMSSFEENANSRNQGLRNPIYSLIIKNMFYNDIIDDAIYLLNKKTLKRHGVKPPEYVPWGIRTQNTRLN